MLTDDCPSGTYVSYSGCGFLEQCCYVPASNNVVTSRPTTSSPTSSQHTQCGVTSYSSLHKIVGGSQTTIEKYPWQVSIHWLSQHECGGSIISDRWILTAAHCILELPVVAYTSQFSIIAGSTSQNYYATNNYYKAIQIMTHPGYVKSTRNDIALIKVDRVIDFSGNKKKPVCLADPGDDFSGQVCVATGWGQIREGDNVDAETYLREVSLPVISHSMCTFYMGSFDSNVMCAGQRMGGKDTCQGDSGGPLVCQTSQGIWKQAGIVSTGVGCAQVEEFGFYTEVSKFRSWIQDTMSRY